MVFTKSRLKNVYDFLGLVYCFIVLICLSYLLVLHDIFHTRMARYCLPVCAKSAVKLTERDIGTGESDEWNVDERRLEEMKESYRQVRRKDSKSHHFLLPAVSCSII